MRHNFAQGDTWLAEKMVNAPGPRSYNVKLSDDRIVRRHADHIRPCSADLQYLNNLLIML